MALYTPLARLGTFLFPSNSRRVTAPMPAPRPAEKRKRRTAICPAESPPKCRRRLSFADCDIALDCPIKSCSSTQITAAIDALDTPLPPARRAAQWTALLHLIQSSSVDLPSCQSRQLASHLLAAAARPLAKVDLPHLAAAASVLDAVTTRSPDALRDPQLVSALISAAIRFPHHTLLVRAVSAMLRRCARDHRTVVAEHAAPLFRAVVGELEGVRDAACWEALVALLAVCVARDVGEKRLRVAEADVNVVLASFERVAVLDAACAEGALHALRDLVEDKTIAAMLVTENGSAVIAEVAAVHAKSTGVQRACVDVLVVLSSPKIFYYISDL